MKGIVTVRFTSDELKAIGLSIGHVLGSFKETDLQPWTPETRKYIKEIRTACNSVAFKLKTHAGIDCKLPDLYPGEENEYLTKES